MPLFEKAGPIWDLRLMMDPLSGLNRGYAFVTFCTKDAAQEAVKLVCTAFPARPLHIPFGRPPHHLPLSDASPSCPLWLPPTDTATVKHVPYPSLVCPVSPAYLLGLSPQIFLVFLVIGVLIPLFSFLSVITVKFGLGSTSVCAFPWPTTDCSWAPSPRVKRKTRL